jgi:hypothetical protein
VTLDGGVERDTVFGEGQMPGINGDREIRAAALLVRRVDRGIQTRVEVAKS